MVRAMKQTPYFKGFHRLFGRAKKSAAAALKERVDGIQNRAPGQLHSQFADVVEPEKIQGEAGSRERIFTADVVFWAMLGQVFRGGSLRDAVREVQAAESAKSPKQRNYISHGTGSYATARQRLPQSALDGVNRRVCSKMLPSQRFLGGRRIMVVDGTGVQLEDTPANQREYPQSSRQQPGCGFPVMQLVALFNLDTTALEHLSCSPLNAHEGSMFDVDLMPHLQSGDVLLADRGFCSYLHFSALAPRGVDVLTRLHSARQWPKGMRGDDVRVEWKRPCASQRPGHITRPEWEALPATCTVRYIRYRIARAGFRPQVIILATTLMEAPAEQLAGIYLQRWGVELCFDDIKTTMGMDFVKTKSPAMAIKMATLHMIAYNLIRLTMHRAARTTGTCWTRLSFKGALDAINRFAAQMHQAARPMIARLRQTLYQTIGCDLLPRRPGRIEPRVLKRRQKPFPLMTRPRAVLRAEIIQNYTSAKSTI